MMTKGWKCRWRNLIGLVVFPIWIRCEDDPLKYVRRAKTTMDKKKNLHGTTYIIWHRQNNHENIWGKVKYKTNINFFFFLKKGLKLILTFHPYV